MGCRIVVAKGRRRQPAKGMNGLERRYQSQLALRVAAGEVVWFAFQPIKLRLAASTFYDPDFLVMLADGSLEVHEVKGHWEDDARVKIKVAAAAFPLRFVGITLDKASGWHYEEFGPC